MTIAKNPKLVNKLKDRKYVEETLCEANKLILKRMESNPDEFHLNKGGRWADYLNMLHARIQGDANVLVMLETDECLFVWDKFKEVSKDNLHKNFMKRILVGQTEEETPQTTVKFSTQGRFTTP